MNIQLKANELANLCLEEAEIHHGYSDYDLFNASLIFSHFLINVIYTENRHLSQEKQLELAETTGKAIRSLIQASTGKDTHEIVKKQLC